MPDTTIKTKDGQDLGPDQFDNDPKPQSDKDLDAKYSPEFQQENEKRIARIRKAMGKA